MEEEQVNDFRKRIKFALDLHYNGPSKDQKVVTKIMIEDILDIVELAYLKGENRGIQTSGKIMKSLIKDMLNSTQRERTGQ